MESKNFSLLLADIESRRTNFDRVEIISCYVAQRFSVEQIVRMVKSISRAATRLKVLKLLAEEMESCNLQDSLAIIESVSMNTNKELQLNCLEELLKYRKLSISESEKGPLLALFVGTELHDSATRLVSKISHKPSTKPTPAHNGSVWSPNPPPATPAYYSPQNAASPYSASNTMPTHPMSQPCYYGPPPVHMSAYPHTQPFPATCPIPAGSAVNPMAIGFNTNLYPSPQPQQQQIQTSSQPGQTPGIGFTI